MKKVLIMSVICICCILIGCQNQSENVAITPAKSLTNYLDRCGEQKVEQWEYSKQIHKNIITNLESVDWEVKLNLIESENEVIDYGVAARKPGKQQIEYTEDLAGGEIRVYVYDNAEIAEIHEESFKHLDDSVEKKIFNNGFKYYISHTNNDHENFYFKKIYCFFNNIDVTMVYLYHESNKDYVDKDALEKIQCVLNEFQASKE